MHAAPWMQSTSAFAQGNAHLPNCVLQWASPQAESFEHGNAAGPGVAIVPPVVEGGAPVVGGAPVCIGGGCP
jgi:hypothetical protein